MSGNAQTARANGFSSVVIDQDSVLIVPDAQADSRFDENIGVLSIGDVAPRGTFSDSEQQPLLDLADIVSGALEARVVAQRTLTNLEPHVYSALEQHRRFVESLRDGIISCDQNGVLSVMNLTAREMYGLEAAHPPNDLPAGGSYGDAAARRHHTNRARKRTYSARFAR